MPEHVYNYATGKVEPKPQGWPRLYPGHRTDDRDYPHALTVVPGAESRYDDDAPRSPRGSSTNREENQT